MGHELNLLTELRYFFLQRTGRRAFFKQLLLSAPAPAKSPRAGRHQGHSLKGDRLHYLIEKENQASRAMGSHSRCWSRGGIELCLGNINLAKKHGDNSEVGQQGKKSPNEPFVSHSGNYVAGERDEEGSLGL